MSKPVLPFVPTPAWESLKTNFKPEMKVQNLSLALRAIKNEQEPTTRRVFSKLVTAVHYLGFHAQTVQELLDIEKPKIVNYFGDKGHKSLLEILKALGIPVEKHKIFTWDYTPEKKPKKRKRK